MLTKDPIYKKQSCLDLIIMIFTQLSKTKKTLNAYDNKRFITDNPTDSLTWGHHSPNINKDNFLELFTELPK